MRWPKMANQTDNDYPESEFEVISLSEISEGSPEDNFNLCELCCKRVGHDILGPSEEWRLTVCDFCIARPPEEYFAEFDQESDQDQEFTEI